MFITYLEAYRCKALKFHGDRFVYKPEGEQHIITGKNGSGKSTIFKLLIPSAQSKGDYEKGGHYILHLTHKGSTFELSSTFVSGADHSFVVDGEEQNPGGTGKVQDSLIHQYFNIDSRIAELLTFTNDGDGVRFSRMPAMKRREWFMRLADANLEYVLDIYHKARKKVTGTKEVVNHLKTKLASETQKLKNDIDLENLQTEIDEMQSIVPILHKEMSNDWETDLTMDDLDFQIKSLTQTIRCLLRMDLSPPRGFSFDSVDSIREALNKLNARKAGYEGEAKGITREADELDRIVQAATSASGAKTLTGLKDEETKLKKDLEEVERKYKHFLKRCQEAQPTFELNTVPDTTKEDLQELSSHLLNAIVGLPETDKPIAYSDQIGKCELQQSRLVEEVLKYKNLINKAETRLEHIGNCSSVTCPKCTHNWKPGVSEGEQQKLEKEVAAHNKRIDDLEDAIEGVKKDIVSNRRKREAVQQFREVMSRWSHHRDLWKVVVGEGLYHKHPQEHEGFYNLYVWLIHVCLDRRDLNNRLVEVQSVLHEIEKHKLAEDGVDSRLKSLEEQYNNLTMMIEQEERVEAQLRDYMGRVETFLAGVDELEVLKSDAYQTILDLAEAKRSGELNEIAKQYLTKLSHAHKAMSEHQTIERMIKDIEESLKEAELDLKGWQLLVRSLSPNEGVIADQISGFIGGFIDQMNDLIADVWTYDMKIGLCTVEDGDLNYKFPLDVMNKTMETKDIKEASKGQKEMIDQAFKIVAQLNLPLEDCPLLLDEPGQGYDPEHLGRLMYYVKQMMDSNVFPQLFMISHDQSGYGVFSHAQVVTMEQREVVLDDMPNEAA